jgi:hypothetical protein
MITLNLTLAKNDKYFTESIILIDHTDQVSPNMDKENLIKIEELLPVKYQNKTILSIERITEIVEIKHEN